MADSLQAGNCLGKRFWLPMLAAAVAFSGCSGIDLGPQPDDYVGASRSLEPGGRAYSDPTLTAVRPVVPGDLGINVMPATMPGVSSEPGTMPRPRSRDHDAARGGGDDQSRDAAGAGPGRADAQGNGLGAGGIVGAGGDPGGIAE